RGGPRHGAVGAADPVFGEAPRRALRLGGELARSAAGALGRRVAQHVAAAPDRLDVIVAFGRGRQLLAQLADEYVDDLELGLVHAAIEMVQEHLLGEGGTLAQAQKLEDAVFLAGEVERPAIDLDGAAVEVDGELAGADHRFRVALGAAHDRLDARDELAPVERLGQEIVGAETQALDLVIELGQARQDEDRRPHPGGAQPAQHFVAVDVRQHQIEDDDVVVVELADLQAVLAEIGGVANEPFGPKHHLDAGRGGRIIFHQKYAHLPASAPTDSQLVANIIGFNDPYQPGLKTG